MTPTAPQIGFDRFIRIEWVAAALKVRAGLASLDDLDGLLDAAALGKEARSKTRTKLNALGLAPRPDLADFIDRGVNIFKNSASADEITPFAWGAAVATYPYFAKIAEFTGRLTSIQGDCSVLELHRRMSEVYGDREIAKRATQAVLQTQANWGTIQRIENGKRLVRLAPRPLSREDVVSWVLEAALRYYGKAMPLATLQSMAVIYPFSFDASPAYIATNSHTLELRAEGANQQFVGLRNAI